MATSSKVHLVASQQPQFRVKGITTESAEKTSQLLQLNHEKHHIFFNRSGFHNHIVHHLLTIYALGASPQEIQHGYDINATYQRPPEPLKDSIVNDMHKPDRFKTYLGKEQYYHDFLVFFQSEIEAKTWQTVLNEYVFAGDERADDLFARLYGGFLHPIIHLGFGIEFEQPAIIAEALAQAAVHDEWMARLFAPCEAAAEKNRGKGNEKTIVELFEEARKNETLKNAARWDDGNKVRDGVLGRAAEELVRLASQYTVDEERLEEQTAEMINAAVYFTSAAQRPPHQIKFDFYYIHCLNSSIFFSTFLNLPSCTLSNKSKRRLLEYKIWTDIAMYTSRHCPALLLDEIKTYAPKQGQDSWDDIFRRVNQFDDDGHASKLVRALAHGENVCKQYEAQDGFPVKSNMWRTLGHMAIDSVEAGDPHWVRSAGFDEAWESVPLREGARL
ncbi:hypothetical protein FB567DRAFT_449318 [Paraphoma chrysanthemicola]|uniref:HypA n=1 Tax=Paraphoma chrysanthemicola TaxID=798071 RepID=A0A8K0VW05_9PLEO|nr:hypothetical protein FB567DRAFT_449318 [Paraphoma chrysanthemicola]